MRPGKEYRDVFLSAARRQMDELEKQNFIVKAGRRVFARNADAGFVYATDAATRAHA